MKRGRTKYDDSEYPIFITTTVTQHIYLFHTPILAKTCLEIIESEREKYKMKLYCYCLMPNHIHLVVQSENRGDLSQFVKSWKALTARVIIEYAEANDSELLSKFQGSAERYSSSLGGRQLHQVWVPRFDDVQLRTSEVLRTKVNYIHANPIRKGIVKSPEEYNYSSAGWYEGKMDTFVSLTDISILLV